ncbi:MAG: class II glutamine amidotransferase [Acidobacteriota bacterium]
MCRFALYLGEEITLSSMVTEPEHSILRQSYRSREREEPLNGDGFGVAWYPSHVAEPAILKEVSPAWNSLNLRSVARATRSHCLLAHIRAASPGLPVTQLNCHPFSRGALSFMHNGTVGGFLRIKHRLVAQLREETYLDLLGSTDSEHLFALIHEAWREAGAEPPLARLASALRRGIERVEALRTAAGVDEPSLLNLVLCDGQRAVVSRYVSDADVPSNSLYVHSGRRYVCEDGVCRMVDPDRSLGAVIVASEPLSADPGWDRVPENHLVKIDGDLGVEMEPLSIEA